MGRRLGGGSQVERRWSWWMYERGLLSWLSRLGQVVVRL